MVTGGQSMIGRQVVELLREKNYFVDPVPHHECDLCNERALVERFEMLEPDCVIHLAGYNGGIHWNKTFPEKIFRRTSKMAMNVLEACSLFDVKKTVSVISACSYPNLQESVMSEDDLWSGPPNPTVECHGFAKRILHAYSRQLNHDSSITGQYICAIINNSYGPWDNYHPFKSKVVSGLIKKFVEAKQNGLESVECWGTGRPRREFTFCRDAARALIHIMEADESPELVNIGSGCDYTIKQLAESIADLVEYKGEIIWDTEKPDGQMRRMLNSDRLRSMGFVPEYSDDPDSGSCEGLRRGLREAIDWYVANKEMADERCSI